MKACISAHTFDRDQKTYFRCKAALLCCIPVTGTERANFLLWCANSQHYPMVTRTLWKTREGLRLPSHVWYPFFPSKWPCTRIQTQNSKIFPSHFHDFQWRRETGITSLTPKTAALHLQSLPEHTAPALPWPSTFGVHALQPRSQGQAAASAGLPGIWAKPSSHLRGAQEKWEKHQAVMPITTMVVLFLLSKLQQLPWNCHTAHLHVPSLHYSLAHFHLKTIESLTLQRTSKTI